MAAFLSGLNDAAWLLCSRQIPARVAWLLVKIEAWKLCGR